MCYKPTFGPLRISRIKTCPQRNVSPLLPAVSMFQVSHSHHSPRLVLVIVICFLGVQKSCKTQVAVFFCQILISRSNLGSLCQAFEGSRLESWHRSTLRPVVVNAAVQYCAGAVSLRETTLGCTFLRLIGFALHVGFLRIARISASMKLSFESKNVEFLVNKARSEQLQKPVNIGYLQC